MKGAPSGLSTQAFVIVPQGILGIISVLFCPLGGELAICLKLYASAPPLRDVEFKILTVFGVSLGYS